MALTLNEKMFGDESRVVFATVPNDRFVDHQVLPGGCKTVLFSFWYLKGRDPAWIKFLLTRTKKTATKLYIDSGVFTLYKKMKVPGINKKQYELPPEVIAEVRRLSMVHMLEFKEYTKAYVNFLNEYDKYIDWAFDMDIDMFTDVLSADSMNKYMIKNLKSPRKIIRIWHITRSFDDWKAWCNSGNYSYLAIEGGGTHGRDVDFYKRFVTYAHSKNVKVHVLAMTSPLFLKHVNCDSADSSTWSVGGRYATVFSKWGLISFAARSGPTYSSQKHWNSLSSTKHEEFIEWIREGGLDYTADDLLSAGTDGWLARNLVNIYYFRSVGNAPVDEDSHSTHRLGILDDY